MKEAFDLQRSFLCAAAGQPEPNADGLQKMTAPLVAKLDAINSTKNGKKGTPSFNHFATIAEGLPALGWISVVCLHYFHAFRE